jgi:hypothetical protein
LLDVAVSNGLVADYRDDFIQTVMAEGFSGGS